MPAGGLSTDFFKPMARISILLQGSRTINWIRLITPIVTTQTILRWGYRKFIRRFAFHYRIHSHGRILIVICCITD